MNNQETVQGNKYLEQLKAMLPERGRVLIVPHNYPDPDALASAAALHLLLAERFRIQGQIVFTGMVSRAENREFLSHYRYTWRLLSQMRELRHRVPCLFIDTNPSASNVTVPTWGRPVAVVDHHPFRREDRWKGIYTDIRPGTGATASILYEYLKAAEVSIPRWLASLMAYAISTETLDLSRNCTPLDLEAYTALLSQANMSIIGEIRHASLPRIYYVRLQEAIQNAFVYGRVAWSHLDEVHEPEIVPEISDLLSRMERISWAFCTAYHEDNLIFSIRTVQKGANCASVLKRVVRKNGSVGGHQKMAAGHLEMRGLNPVEREERRETFIKTLLGRIERRVIEADVPLISLARPLTEIKDESPH